MQGPDPEPFPLDHLTLRGAPGAAALVTREGILDYAGLERSVGALAAGLRAQGLSAGDRVASWLPKTWMTSLLPLACARVGLIHVPINPLLKRAQAAHILADSGARLLVVNSARLDSLEPGDLADAKSAALEQWRADEPPLAPSTHDPDELCALL